MPYRGTRFRGGESHLPHRLPLTARARFAPTAGVVHFRGAAALHAHGGKGEGQEIRAERGGAALTGIGGVLPAGDIQPAAAAVLFGSGIELHIAPAVPQLRVEPQHGAQGGEAAGPAWSCRRHVTGGQAGAAGGDDEGDAQLVGAAAQLSADLRLLIGHHGRVGHGETRLRQHGGHGGAAGILPQAAAAQVADGDDGCCIRHMGGPLSFATL